MSKPLFNALLSLLFISLFLTSCDKTPDLQFPENEPEYITVSLCMGGEITVESDPLTKAGTPTNDLYGINVYYNANKDNNITTPYAYGLFDNVEDMTISLLSGHKYKFACTLVKDGKNKIESSNAGKFEAPFGQVLQNQFVVGTTTVMPGITSGEARLKGKSSNTSIPQLDRFYGELTNYQPVVGGSANIDLTRTVFGAKFIITGLVNDGTLTASCGDFWSITTTDNVEEDACIYSFPDVLACWQNKNSYTWENALTVNYDSDRGALWDISLQQTITLKRNVLTTISISVTPDMSGASFSINEEDMGEDNIINLGIDSEGAIGITSND